MTGIRFKGIQPSCTETKTTSSRKIKTKRTTTTTTFNILKIKTKVMNRTEECTSMNCSEKKT
jgi:hypothetical protein